MIRCRFVAVVVAGLLAAATPVGCGSAPDSRDEPGEPVVEIEAGAVRGTEAGQLARFRGIPYAAPPVGERRWQPPLLQGNTADEHIEFILAAYPEPLTAGRYSAVLRTAFGPMAADWPRLDEQNIAIRFQDNARQVDLNTGHHCGLWAL